MMVVIVVVLIMVILKENFTDIDNGYIFIMYDFDTASFYKTSTFVVKILNSKPTSLH